MEAEFKDVIIETLGVLINHILYTRNLYPKALFKKCLLFATPIYMSTYPALNTYLLKSLAAVRELLRQGKLEQIVLRIYRDENHDYEFYRFRFRQNLVTQLKDNNDEFLLEFEQDVRFALYLIYQRVKQLQPLPSDAQFQILLYTKQDAFIKLCHNVHYQDFPWLQTKVNNNTESLQKTSQQQIFLLPLAFVGKLSLSLTADIFK